MLLQRIQSDIPKLSPQFRVIAKYVLERTEYIFRERILDVAVKCGTQPSAVVRFAKRYGFTGFHDFKLAFVVDGHANHRNHAYEYQQRIASAKLLLDASVDQSTAAAFEFIDRACEDIKLLRRNPNFSDMREAVSALANANVIWIIGAGRAFSVASYLAYGLQNLDKPIQLIQFTGGMHTGQLRGIRPNDAMIAISFAPYSDETILATLAAKTVGAAVVCMTDSLSSPLVGESTAHLLVQEGSVHGFRAVTNAITLAQALFLALAFLRPDSYSSDPSS
jgi:DNA-binding MurR/RpiR family transcriptional regulator